MNTKLLPHPLALSIASFGCLVLLSPKWVFPPAAWVAPMFLLLLMDRLGTWKSYGVAVSILFTSSLVAQYKVMPFPGIFFFVMVFIISLQAAIPYAINRILWPKIKGWKKTLVFPCALVTYEYVSSFGGGGSWGSIAYTQVSNTLLIQSVSLAGIWIITFLIGWCSSLLFWLFKEQGKWRVVNKTVFVFGLTVLILMFYGLVRTNLLADPAKETVRVAGITGSNVPLLKAMYEDTFGKQIIVNEATLTQTSPELAELNKGFVAFIENPFDPKFSNSGSKIILSQDSLFQLGRKEADAGAKIIAWSEACAFTVKSEEQELLKKGEVFARENNVYFFMAVASIIPGKIEMGKKFIENKVVLFEPSGKILNVFFKNRPVPVVEPSVSGNGIVPVIHTPFGKLGVSICYDADFPVLMRQLGTQSADILILPSGDWKEVSPYHGQMATIRAIENGTSLLRPASGAQSIATDFRGNVIGRRNYYDRGNKVVVAYLPTKGTRTLYTIVGDSLPWLCVVTLMISMIRVVFETRYPIAVTSIRWQ